MLSHVSVRYRALHACSVCYSKMAASFAWLSVIVKGGHEIEQKSKIVHGNYWSYDYHFYPTY